ncbi:C4-dicarboxylate ABC transporter [Clostridiales bacterium PH28_bin88]|nr:C4-dicarboxylate ABC transporter [Clostridiales bacterium PH28_bin88]
MKKTKKIISIALVMLMVLSLMTGCASKSATKQEAPKQEAPKEKFVLKFNHVLAPSEPYHQGFLNWAERVKERTNGGLEIQVFPSAQLGKEEDIIEQLRQGANVGQNTDSARLGMYVPEIAVMNAPYFVDSIEEVLKLKELPSVKKWQQELEDKYGIKILSFTWVQGLRHMVTNKPIRTPEDLKGLRIRTPGAPIWQESIRSLGAAPVALAFGEIYTAMQTKAIDGADLVYRNVTGAKLYEAAKYMSETKHILLINFQIVGKKFFDSLPAEYQQILIEEADKAGLETSKLMEKEIETLKQELTSKGMTIVEDVDIAAFKQAGEAAYKTLNLTGIRDQIYRELGKK